MDFEKASDDVNREERSRYYASREWAVLREKVRERSGGFCEVCWLRDMEQTHHLTYERMGCEELEDLQAICDPCHRYVSGKESDRPDAVDIKAAELYRFDLWFNEFEGCDVLVCHEDELLDRLNAILFGLAVGNGIKVLVSVRDEFFERIFEESDNACVLRMVDICAGAFVAEGNKSTEYLLDNFRLHHGLMRSIAAAFRARLKREGILA